jgi:hypothetical protein
MERTIYQNKGKYLNRLYKAVHVYGKSDSVGIVKIKFSVDDGQTWETMASCNFEDFEALAFDRWDIFGRQVENPGLLHLIGSFLGKV